MLLPEEKMKEILAWLLRIETHNIHPLTSLRDDLLLDELDLELLISTLELHLGVYLNDEEASAIDTVQDLTFNLRRAAA